MIDPRDTPGVAEAARLLDDVTQQLTPVPALLDEETRTERIGHPQAAEDNLDGHVF